MVLVTHSWRAWTAGLVASLVIFGVLFFTVIQPSTNTANQAVKAGLQESQQAIKQTQHQINNAVAAGNQAAGTAKHADKQAAVISTHAKQQLNQAGKLASCVTAAGTDTGKIQACQAKYQP